MSTHAVSPSAKAVLPAGVNVTEKESSFTPLFSLPTMVLEFLLKV